VTPAQAVEFEHEENYYNVINSVKDKTIKPSPFQNSYAEGQVVRLRIPKGKLQAKPVAKKLAFARRVSDSYRRFAPRIAEGRDPYYFNLAGTFRVLDSFKKF
jgi:hypothetical protein